MSNNVDAELTERSKEAVAALEADAAWIRKRKKELVKARQARRKAKKRGNGKT